MSKQGVGRPPSRPEESKLDKIKHFLGIGSGKGGSFQGASVRQQAREFVFTPEVLKEIGPTSPANNRMKIIRELSEVVKAKRLEENAVEALWKSVKDLLGPRVGREDRHIALHFLTSLIQGQYDHLGIMRAHFFRVIKGHTLFEDLPQRLELFKVLSSNGKDLTYFEEEAGDFLLAWMKDIISSPKIAEFLSLLVNVIKFNAAYLDEDIVAALVLHTTFIANRTGREEDIQLCLQVMDTVVAYSCLPAESLHHFTACLCGIVGIERFCQLSWMLMRKLLGTHLGHRGIYTMCCILQDKNNITDSGAILLRGAVFFLGMALWGSKKVPSLKHPPSSVLPSFLQALEHSQSSSVAYEIVLSVQRLVHKYGKEQQMVTWDIILDLIDALLRHIESTPSVNPVLVSSTHDLFTAVEELYERAQFNGSSERFFAIIETCANKRPETSILALVQYKAEAIQPVHDSWLQALHQMVDKYFKHEVRTRIRRKVLDLLSNVLSDNKQLYEDELIEVVVLPHLSHIEHDPDLEVRQRATQLLVDQASSCNTLRGLDLLELIHKIINRPMSTSTPASPVPASVSSAMVDGIIGSKRHLDPKMDDIMTAVSGLINIFKTKLFELPSSHPLRIFELLVGHVQAHYHNDHMIRCAGPIRKAIFELLLSLRADGLYRLGIQTPGMRDRRLTYSPHVLCSYSGTLPELLTKNATMHSQYMDSRPEMSDRHIGPNEAASSPTPVVRSSPSTCPNRITIIPYSQAFTVIKDCLEMEMDWGVLKVVLEEMPQVLQNKTLILAAQAEDIDRFCARLCGMLSKRGLGLPERLHNTPPKFTKSDFHSYIFPVLTCLVSYHTHLEKPRQIELVKCLEFGLVSKCAKDCVRAMTVCSLEMVEIMMRQLPAILVKLSQISATIGMAIPLMEFLSSLIHIPVLYANFVEAQYMSIFAIALPYTNPFKYTHYTVSLAYHVIAMWFLKCKLPFRKRFVGFIVKGLRANVLREFEESVSQRARANMDSADRSRTQSLNDEALRRAPNPLEKAAAARSAAVSKAQGSAPAAEDESMMQFHKELMETCIDMMARYTFSTCASIPKRTPVADFLLAGGHTQSWFLGNKIITITTSGGAGVGNSGLCDKCLMLARAAAKERSEASKMSSEMSSREARRKRHKSAAVKSHSETVTLKPLSQVEILVDTNADGVLDSSDPTEPELSPIFGDTLHSGDDLHLHLQAPRMAQSEGSLLHASDHTLAPTVEDAAEDGATSVESIEEKVQMMDSVLMGLKPNPTDKSIFTKRQCNCWCTLWSEIYIRRPTGNASWMMRIQNEQDLAESFPEFPLADISSLFMNQSADKYEYMTRKKIDSMTLGETEYDSLLEEHFERDIPDVDGSSENGEQKDDSLEEPSTQDATGSLLWESTKEVSHCDQDTEVVMRKCSSSPELLPSNQGALITSQETDSHGAPAKTVNFKQYKELDASKFESDVPKPDSPMRKSAPSTSQPASLEQNGDDLDAAPRRSRSHTTVVAPSRKISLTNPPRRVTSIDPPSVSALNKDGVQSLGGISPSFLFLQLYHSQLLGMGEERPLLLPPTNPVVERAVKMLDLMYPYETHKLGVLYVGPGQETDQQAILANQFGSSRYAEFLQGLGDLMKLADCNPESTYVGGLDLHGQDGQFAYGWHDDFIQVIFHVATLMPNKESDPNCNAKKLHIGNDYVTIVYNESGADYKIGTIKGQFNYVNVIVQPLDHGSNAVVVQTKDDIVDIIGHTDTKIISDVYLSKLVRQMAVHANLASMILQRQKTNPRDPFASNWLERLRKIKHVKAKAMAEAKKDSERQDSTMPEDFTDYV